MFVCVCVWLHPRYRVEFSSYGFIGDWYLPWCFFLCYDDPQKRILVPSSSVKWIKVMFKLRFKTRMPGAVIYSRKITADHCQVYPFVPFDWSAPLLSGREPAWKNSEIPERCQMSTLETGNSMAWWWFSQSVIFDSWDPMDCSLPGSSVHGILQARILECIAPSFSIVWLKGQYHSASRRYLPSRVGGLWNMEMEQ